MSLLQNVTSNAQYPYRRSGATATNTETGFMRSQHGIRATTQAARFMAFPETSAHPNGYSIGMFPPLSRIDMSSLREADVAVTAAGNGAMGVNIACSTSFGVRGAGTVMAIVWANGAASFSSSGTAVVTGLAYAIASGAITVDAEATARALAQMEAGGSFSIAAQALGELIAAGSGVALFAIDADGDMVAALSGEGLARFSLAAEGDLVGALFGTAGARFAIDADGALSALGELAAAGLIGVAGELAPFGLGQMTASTEGGGATLTPGSVAAAVWAAAAAANDTAGSMGEKLNDAGSAANPWTEVIESGYTAAEILRVLAAVAAGKKSVASGVVKFRDLGDQKDRVTGTISGGDRTAVTLEVDA